MDDLCLVVITCSLFSCLPRDIHLKIASLLPFRDVCALGQCSRYWRELCDSNSIWKSLSIHRWPPLSTLITHQIGDPPEELPNPNEWPPKIQEIQNWKLFYYNRQSMLCLLAHTQTYDKIVTNSSRIRFADSACKRLADHCFSFIDVEMFSFSPSIGTVINMIGVLYSIKCLSVDRQLVAEALRRRKIHNRNVFLRRQAIKKLCASIVPREFWSSALTLERVVLERYTEDVEDCTLDWTEASIRIEDVDWTEASIRIVIEGVD